MLKHFAKHTYIYIYTYEADQADNSIFKMFHVVLNSACQTIGKVVKACFSMLTHGESIVLHVYRYMMLQNRPKSQDELLDPIQYQSLPIFKTPDGGAKELKIINRKIPSRIMFNEAFFSTRSTHKLKN